VKSFCPRCAGDFLPFAFNARLAGVIRFALAACRVDRRDPRRPDARLVLVGCADPQNFPQNNSQASDSCADHERQNAFHLPDPVQAIGILNDRTCKKTAGMRIEKPGVYPVNRREKVTIVIISRCGNVFLYEV